MCISNGCVKRTYIFRMRAGDWCEELGTEKGEVLGSFSQAIEKSNKILESKS